jgi:hypothetical protein
MKSIFGNESFKNHTERQNEKMLIKFFILKIKKLLTNEHGEMIYDKSFDMIINDIFGVKDFSKDLGLSYNDAAVLKSLEKIGIENLYKLCNKNSLYEAIEELVILKQEIINIQKMFKKKKHKGKHISSSEEKMYRYFIKKYNYVIKYMRKNFKIKNNKNLKTKYKKRFKILDNLKPKNIYNDNFGTYSYYNDDDDEYDDESEFKKFVDSFKSTNKINNNKDCSSSIKPDEEQIENNKIYNALITLAKQHREFVAFQNDINDKFISFIENTDEAEPVPGNNIESENIENLSTSDLIDLVNNTK